MLLPVGQIIENKYKIVGLIGEGGMVENSFGILSQRWRVYQRKIVLEPESAITVIKATLVLHNFLTQEDVATQQPAGGNRIELLTPNMAGNRASTEALDIRNKFAEYFSSNYGSVPWQNDRV